MSSVPVVSVLGLEYSFGERKVVRGLSFDLNRGDILSFIGPNGVGKTTALRAIAGILPLDRKHGSGVVKYLGQDFLQLSSRERAQRVVYLTGDVRVEFPLTAFELVQLGRLSAHSTFLAEISGDDYERIRRAMELCGCWELRSRDYQTLSGGERQLVCFARGVAQGAQVLFLDESFSRLDLHHQARIGEVLNQLAQEGFSFVLVSHDFNFVLEYSTQCLAWPADGNVVQGSARELMDDALVSRLYPNARIFTGKNPRTGAPKLFFDR